MKFDEILIEKISFEDFSLPSQYGAFYFYAQCKNQQIAEINVQQLRVLYSKNDRDITFKKFLEAVLNQKQNLAESADISCFDLSHKITEEYYKMVFQKFIEMYFEKVDESYRLKKGIPDEERKTIFYYCFINNYLATFDDYIGCYYLTKATDLF